MAPARTFEQDWNEPQPSADRPADLPYTTENERTWALFMHLSHLVGLFVGIPLVTPLILWLIKKDESAFLDDHGKETLNFEISLILYAIVATLVALPTCGLGFLMLLPLWALGIIGTTMGIAAGSKGRYFRYPMTLRLVT
jgi:uncharacterized protein